MHFIRWLGGAERRAGFLFAQFTGGAGRWPSLRPPRQLDHATAHTGIPRSCHPFLTVRATTPVGRAWADSSGGRNTLKKGVAMKIQRRRSDRAGRAPLPSPGRPPVAGRDERRRFWAAIAATPRLAQVFKPYAHRTRARRRRRGSSDERSASYGVGADCHTGRSKFLNSRPLWRLRYL